MTSGPGVVVIGGGITGLAAAYRLRQLTPDLPITLIERESRPGGKIATEQSDSLVIEHGPDSFLAAKPRGTGLCQELGLGDQLQGPRQETRGSYILHDGQLYPLPEGLSGLIPTRLGPIIRTPLLTPAGKLRLGLDFVRPRRRDEADESLAAFIQRRLGRQAYERLVEPLMTGIYGGDGTRLSLAATFPQLRQAEREYGGLIKGLIATRRTAKPSATSRAGFLTPVEGMSALPQALETALRAGLVEIKTSAVAASITPTTGTTPEHYVVQLADGTELPAAAVILATPAFASADLIAAFNPAAASVLRQIPYSSTAIVTMAFKQTDLTRPLPGHGYIVPRIEQRPVLACTITSAKWPNRAPAGTALVRVFLGRSSPSPITELSDDRLLELATTELKDTLGITGTPTLTRINRWPRAMPQYELGHLDRLATLEQLLASTPGLILAGAAYRGVGIPDCIASGEMAAARVTAMLQQDGKGGEGGNDGK